MTRDDAELVPGQQPDDVEDADGLDDADFRDDALDDDASQVLELPDVPRTGDLAVDDAVQRLVAVTGATLEEQLPVLEAVHRTLQDRLADVEG